MISKDTSHLVDVGQIAAMLVMGTAAAVSVAATGLAFAGILPWPEIAVAYGATEVAWAGKALQIGATVLLVTLMVFLPSARRVLRLETSHRQFQIGMDDITRAYRAAHLADRSEIFEMQREFDAVRERYQYLRDNPDLAEIDAELLTIAAQMSEQSREFAKKYSVSRIARAREALLQRRADAEALHERIQVAHAGLREVRRLMEDVDVEESSVEAQIRRLREEVAELDLARAEPKPGTAKKPHLKSVKPA